jgi:hypothetical protein
MPSEVYDLNRQLHCPLTTTRMSISDMPITQQVRDATTSADKGKVYRLVRGLHMCLVKSLFGQSTSAVAFKCSQRLIRLLKCSSFLSSTQSLIMSPGPAQLFKITWNAGRLKTTLTAADVGWMMNEEIFSATDPNYLRIYWAAVVKSTKRQGQDANRAPAPKGHMDIKAIAIYAIGESTVSCLTLFICCGCMMA